MSKKKKKNWSKINILKWWNEQTVSELKLSEIEN